MATSTDVIPKPDYEFDTLQGIIVNKATLNKVAWVIPDAEITKLTDKQTIWDAAWLIAKDKLNSTTSQKKAKDLARRQYEKVLRPFIQKWIYRNENMDDEAVELCGLRPRDLTPTAGHAPDMPAGIIIKRGTTGELLSQCDPTAGAETYGCILVAGKALGANVVLSDGGQLSVLPGAPVTFVLDLNKSRKKKFTALTPGTDYYFYYYTANRKGVSALSPPVIMKSW